MTTGFTRRYLAVVMVAAVAGIAPVLGAGQTPQADFERARLLEENGRTLSDAIALYKRVADEPPRSLSRSGWISSIEAP
jgi:hypothetical protein